MNDTIVKCFHCGSEFLHQYECRIFDRKEDAAEGTFVLFRDGGMLEVNTPWSMSGCPSPRRGGVKISMICENCYKLTVMSVYQHKGSTYIETGKHIPHEGTNPPQEGLTKKEI
jgi:hypothetical protein